MESNTYFVQPKINENGWVIQMKEGLHVLQQQEEEEELRASVFNVPRELLAAKPEAYIPHSVSIGPYHHWRSEQLYEMERYKLAAVHRFEKRIDGRGKFQTLVVKEFQKQDWQIRSCYHKFIDYKEETLAWIMALDAVFLLECFQFYVRHANETSSNTGVKQLGQVLHPTGNSATHNSIVRDVMMLENQLPLFLLQKLLELQLGSKAEAQERLSRLLGLVCQELSPFTFRLPDNSNLHRGHVLEVLYYAIVPTVSNNPNNQKLYPSDEKEHESPDTVDMSTIKKALSTLLWKSLSFVNIRPLRVITSFHRKSLKIRPLTVVDKKDTIKSEDEGEHEGEGNGEESFIKIIPPTRDELAIPSVADLHSVGVKFVPTKGDLTAIRFDEKTATLYLPSVRLDTNTEVILRNLVAFEASAAHGAMVFTRYTDFMNGIIDHKEDVRLLRDSGIISNHLKGDEEVASLWNSLGRGVHLTKVEFLDKVIVDVNTYYNRKWKVVVVKFVKEHILGSWQFLTLVAAVILLALSCLQGFCSVYECKTWLNQANILSSDYESEE